jgi:hypothetical protein
MDPHGREIIHVRERHFRTHGKTTDREVTQVAFIGFIADKQRSEEPSLPSSGIRSMPR